MDQHQLLNTTSVIALIEDAIRHRAPYSLVRLGDGEGALLDFSPQSQLKDYAYLDQHFGKSSTATWVFEAQVRLNTAIGSADLLGVRDDVWQADVSCLDFDPDDANFLNLFKQNFPLRSAEKLTIDLAGAQRIFMLFRWLKNQTVRSIDRPVCSQWVNADLQLLGFWDNLIAQERRIGLIYHSPSLAERIRHRFSISVDFLQIPLNPIEGNVDALTGRTHSQLRSEIVGKIPHNLGGQIFFVSAGLIGKYYAHVIKQNGGIAFDIGALSDAWDGRTTRRLVARHKAPLTSSHFGPPPAMLLGFPAKTKTTKRPIFLHVGFSKTGTTALQEFLSDNERLLSADGIRYLQAGRTNGADINHHELARAFGVGERGYAEVGAEINLEALGRLLSEIDQELDMMTEHTALISSELFSNFVSDRQGEDLFLKWLASHDITVLCTIRDQFEWLVSWYTQAAKNGNMGLYLDEFLEDPLQLPNSERFDGNFLRKIEYFARYVGRDKVRVFSYEHDMLNGGIIFNFLRRLGIRKKVSDRELTKLNVSPRTCLLVSPIVSRRLGLPIEITRCSEDKHQNLCDRIAFRGEYAKSLDRLKSKISQQYSNVNAELSKWIHE